MSMIGLKNENNKEQKWNTKSPTWKNDVLFIKIRAGELEETMQEIADIYNQIEIENFSNINAVLVSASTLDNLKEAYPNYFADMKQFVNMMRKVLKDT